MMRNRNLILYGGGVTLLVVTYLLSKKEDTIPEYAYHIYIENGVTKALNDYTGDIDFTGDTKTVIESATAVGKTFIQAGTYETYNTNLPSGTWIDGDGPNTILKCPNNTQENIISTFNKDNITVRSLTIDGNRFNNTRGSNTAKQNGMYFSGCSNLDIENCYAYHTIESGIQVTGRDGTPSSNIKILNNTVYDTWAEGIVLFDGVSNIELKYNTSSNNGELANGGYSGITIMRNISNADIQYNTTFGNTIDGIAIDGDPGFENKNITVNNNVSYSNTMSGIALHNTINSNASNNTTYDNLIAGMWIADSCDSIYTTNNNIHDNTEFGMNILSSSNITIQQTHVKNTSKWDCINADTCTTVKILNSEIEGAKSFGTRLKNCTNCTIDGNNYHHNNKINIDLDTSSNNTITNNDTHHSNEDGLALDFNSHDNLIQYNNVHDNLHFGIATDTVLSPHYGHNTIDTNDVYNNGWDGIIAIRGDYNIISNNNVHDNIMSGILIEGRIQSEGTNPDGRANYNNIHDNECWNNDYGIREFYYECKYNAFNRNNTHNNQINQMLEGYLHNIDDKCAEWSMINNPNYTVQNNTWGLGNISLETECIFADSNNIGWNWNRPNGGNNITYPNVNVGVNRGIPSWTVFPKEVSEFTEFTFNMTYSYPQLPTGVYNLAPEVYLREDATYLLMPKAEIMFYLDHSSTNPAIEFGLGTYLGDVNDGNLVYKLYYRTWTDGWRLFTFVRNGIGNTTSGPHTYTINIKFMLDYMLTHDLLDTGTKMIDPNWYALGFECGNEIYHGTGKIEISQLNINVNGQQITI